MCILSLYGMGQGHKLLSYTTCPTYFTFNHAVGIGLLASFIMIQKQLLTINKTLLYTAKAAAVFKTAAKPSTLPFSNSQNQKAGLKWTNNDLCID